MELRYSRLTRPRRGQQGQQTCRHAPIRYEEWDPERVLDYYAKHGTSDEGCSIDRVVRGLGYSRDRVKDAVDFLSSQGYLKSTVDDDHHKATSAGTRP